MVESIFSLDSDGDYISIGPRREPSEVVLSK
jgi:hypothetical protein